MAGNPHSVRTRGIPRGVGFSPEGVQLRRARQIRERCRWLEVAKKFGKAAAIVQQARVDGRVMRHVKGCGCPEPIAANQPRHHRKVGLKRVNARLHYRVAVHRKGRLGGERLNPGVCRCLRRQQGLGKRLLELTE